MKKVFVFISILILIQLTSCIKDPNHSVSIKNLTDRPILITIDDTIKFDTIDVNQKSQYVPLEEGSHRIGGDSYGQFTVEGKGTIKWTIEVYEDDFALKQD